MTLEEIEQYFGSLYRACITLGLKPPNITKWRRNGYVPLLQQYRIAELTEGRLMPDEKNPAKLKTKQRLADAKKTI